MPGCTLCGDESAKNGFLVVNERLFRDPLCDECRDSTADEISEMLQGGDVDEMTRLTAIREFLTHSDRGEYDTAPPEEAVDYALQTAGVPREDRISVLDCLTLQEDKIEC